MSYLTMHWQHRLAVEITHAVLDRLSDEENIIDTAPQGVLVAQVAMRVRETLEQFAAVAHPEAA